MAWVTVNSHFLTAETKFDVFPQPCADLIIENMKGKGVRQTTIRKRKNYNSFHFISNAVARQKSALLETEKDLCILQINILNTHTQLESHYPGLSVTCDT